jgi:hypothetical protein
MRVLTVFGLRVMFWLTLLFSYVKGLNAYKVNIELLECLWCT